MRVRIPSVFLQQLLVRGAILWLLVRLMAVALLRASGQAAESGVPLWTVAMAASLVLVDLHRRKEIMLLQNLGITTVSAVSMAALPAVAFEVALLFLP